MSVSILFAATLQAVSLTTTPVDPASAEARAVMSSVEPVFAAIAARDATILEPYLDPEARITVALEGPEGGRTVRLTREAFMSNLEPGTERLEEIMPNPIVAIDGDVAVVFGRYLFRVDGQVTNCGANHFDMVRKEGAWIIVGLTWNVRTDGCER